MQPSEFKIKRIKGISVAHTDMLLRLLRCYNDFTQDDIGLSELLQRSRYRRLVEARYFIMKYLHEQRLITYQKIASLFHRNHATVLYGVKLIDTIPYLRSRYRLFVQRIENKKMNLKI